MEKDNKILFYEGRYYMFSNFSSFAVEWKGVEMMTSEHAYQAEKFVYEAKIWTAIVNAKSAHDTKQIAKANKEKRRPDWDEIKLRIMDEVIQAKLDQHPFIQKRLIETGERELVEDSPKDSFWGRGSDWRGQNHLGKIWMKKRIELVIRRLEEMVHNQTYSNIRLTFGGRVLNWEGVLAEVRSGTDFGKNYYSSFLEVLQNKE